MKTIVYIIGYGVDMNLKQTYNLNEISKIVAPVAADFGIRKLSVFGSYARGDEAENSDIDFHIIDRGTLKGLIKLAAFELALEDLLKKKVDVVTSGSLFDDVKLNIEREEFIVYEAQ